MTPLAIDLFCGLGGWSEGLLAEGWRVIGYDIEEHAYGELHYPGELIIQDVLTLHGSQCKDAHLILASPPCQEYSYMAMPWSKAKAIERDYIEKKRDRKKLTALFDACFRIQREASEAAGRYIPMVVENVRGAQKWVGKARWNFGSYYLWGDVPALMPITQPRRKSKEGSWDQTRKNFNPDKTWDNGMKSEGMNWSDRTKKGQDFTRLAGQHCGLKQKDKDGYERNHPATFGWKMPSTSSHSSKRKAASAMIAKIPLPLAQWIAKTMKPSFSTIEQRYHVTPGLPL